MEMETQQFVSQNALAPFRSTISTQMNSFDLISIRLSILYFVLFFPLISDMGRFVLSAIPDYNICNMGDRARTYAHNHTRWSIFAPSYVYFGKSVLMISNLWWC